MSVAPTFPGVYVEELPSGVHTVVGVSTAVTAFLGNFAQGPMNTPVTVFSVADVERAFGPLTANSEAGYAVRQFFANGGAQAVIVRVAGGSGAGAAAKASVEIEDSTSTVVLKAVAASEGAWGGLVRLAVDHNTTDAAHRFNLTVVRVDTSTPPVPVATETYLNLSMDPGNANYAVAVVNAGSQLVQLSQVSPPTPPTVAGLPVSTGTVSGDLSGLDATTTQGMDTTVKLGGATVGDLKITGKPQSLTELAGMLQAGLRALGTPPPQLSAATVQVINGPGTEKHLQISALLSASHSLLTFEDDGSQTLATTLKLTAGAGGVANVQQYALGDTTGAGSQTGGVAGSDGANGGLPDAASLIGDPLARTGIRALDTAQFNLLCLPDTSRLADSDAFAVISAATPYCQSRWAFLLVDPPQGTTDAAGSGQRDSLTGIQSWLGANGSLRSSYSALYYPRPRIPDPLNGFRLRSVAASGTVAGLYARTDTERGVWKAPAGTTAALTNVAALAHQLTDAENGVLNPLGINCLRSLPVYGTVCWGARTLLGADQMASEWKYVPVRRLALYLEASLFNGTQWVVFEPNDEPLWAQIRLNVGAFLQQLFRQGAFQGSKPSDAYFVRCDSTTTTQADINQGVVNIVVGFAPLKPAEFVVLQIQQIAGQIAS
jgi:phage tail sheath protein FI